MDFRRIPFQFSSTDPAKRQAELQKRFGLPTKQEKMYVDLANPSFMGSKESNSASNSPRLQHRVPIFVESMSDKSSADANPTNVDAGQKPRVRIVPIEIENSDASTRHRTLSGSSCADGSPYHQGSWIADDIKPKRSLLPDDIIPKAEAASLKSPKGPRVCTIPIKIEGSDKNKKAKATTPEKKKPVAKVIPVQKQNGCNVTKISKSGEKKVPLSPVFQASLKKIDVVLEKLKAFQSDVEKFAGTVKEKQYRYLDEMLTRLMLDLDNVETFGNEEVRLARKAAIKKVQHCIDLLESKVNENSGNQMEGNSEVAEESPELGKESEIVDTDPVKESVNGSTTEVPEVEISLSKDSAVVETNPVNESVNGDDQTSDCTTEVSEIEMEDPLKKESEMVNTDPVEESTSGVNSAKDSTTEVPEVEMKEPSTNDKESKTVEVQERQLMETDESQTKSGPHDEQQLSQLQPMEIDGAQNVSTSEEPFSELVKDSANNFKGNCSEPSTTSEFHSKLATQSDSSEKMNPSSENTSDMELNSELLSKPCQHSNDSNNKAATADPETSVNSDVKNSKVTVKDKTSLNSEL